MLEEVPSDLERQIGVARRAVTATYLDTQARVQGVVSRWIGIEQAVERELLALDSILCLKQCTSRLTGRMKSLVAPEEPLTPGLLYVGVATLTGSVIARNRIIFARLLLPPTLLVLSMNHFLPKTSHNVSAYFSELEDKYLPAVAEKHAIANAHTAMTWERAKEATANSQESLGRGVDSLLTRVQDSTGLKLKEALGMSEKPSNTVRTQIQDATSVVQTKAAEAQKALETKTEELKEAVEKKVEEVKRLV